MRSYIGIAVVAACACLYPGCAENQTKSADQAARYVGFVHQDVLKAAGLQYYWDVQVPLGPGEKIGRFFAMDETIYCMTNQNNVYAVDAAVGLYKWSNSVANSNQTLYNPIHYDEMGVKVKTGEVIAFNGVLFNTLDQVMVYDRAKGTLMSRFSLGFSANTTGTTDGKYFYDGGTDGLYYSLRIADGIEKWKLGMDFVGNMPNEIADLYNKYKNSVDANEQAFLKAKIDGMTKKMESEVVRRPHDLITAPLEYFNGLLFVANEAGQLLATKVDTMSVGEKVWGFIAPAGFCTPFIVRDSGIYIACNDKRIYAKHYSNGRDLESWKDGPFMTDGVVERALQATIKGLYAYAANDAFYAINIVNGKLMWKKPDARVIVGCGQNKLYLLDKDNNLLVVNETTGAVSATFSLTGMDFVASNTNLNAERIFAATASGKVFCIAPLNAGYRGAEMFRSQTK